MHKKRNRQSQKHILTNPVSYLVKQHKLSQLGRQELVKGFIPVQSMTLLYGLEWRPESKEHYLFIPICSQCICFCIK